MSLISGLIGYWNLNDGSGLVAQDLSGEGNNGTLEGSMTAADWVKGISGKALDFDGSDDRVDCGNGSPLSGIGSGDFSISFWMKSKDTTPLNFGRLFSKWQDNNNRIGIYSNGTVNNIRVGIVKSATSLGMNFDADPFDTYWHHIVLIIDRTADEASLYYDGQKDAKVHDLSTLPSDCSNTGNVSFGATNNGSDAYEGIIDECRIYNRKLTDEEAKQLYEDPSGITIQSKVQIKVFSPTDELVAIISDSDLSGDILEVVLNVLKIGKVDAFNFTLSRNTDKPISENAECYFYIDGKLWFIGFIKEIPEPDQDNPVLKFLGRGFVHRLENKFINTSYTSQTLSAIISDLGTNYLSSDLGVTYDSSKIDVPTISNITIEFKDKHLYDVFSELLKIANYDYDNNKYHFYVDNEKDLVFAKINTTLDYKLFEGYNYQSPQVSIDTAKLVNKIFAFRTISGTPKQVEYVATYQDTESQGRYGIFDKKVTFPDYADNTTISNICNSIIERRANPQKRIEIENFEIDSVFPFQLHALSNKRQLYWGIIAECDTTTGWNVAGLSATTFSVSKNRVLTGRRALKFVTASGSNGDFVEYTLDRLLPFPINLRFFIYFETIAIPVDFTIIDKDDAETVYNIDQIVNEWIKIEREILQVTDLGFMKVDYDATNSGYLIVNYSVPLSGKLIVRKEITPGPRTIKKIRITINSDVATTFYIDRIEVHSDTYKYSELILEEAQYNLSSKGLFLNASFGDKYDNILDEIDEKVEDGNIALKIFSKQ